MFRVVKFHIFYVYGYTHELWKKWMKKIFTCIKIHDVHDDVIFYGKKFYITWSNFIFIIFFDSDNVSMFTFWMWKKHSKKFAIYEKKEEDHQIYFHVCLIFDMISLNFTTFFLGQSFYVWNEKANEGFKKKFLMKFRLTDKNFSFITKFCIFDSLFTWIYITCEKNERHTL